MTEDELLEIEGLLKASTAGSRSYSEDVWVVGDTMFDGWLVASIGQSDVTGEELCVWTKGVHASELRGGPDEDAAFIAAAPRAVRSLIEEVRRLRKFIEDQDIREDS